VDSLLLFLTSTCHSTQVRVFILQTHRAQGQRGLCPLTPHLPAQRAVYLRSPRERRGLTACDTTCQHDWVTNLSSNPGPRGDVDSKWFFWEGKKKNKINSSYDSFLLSSFSYMWPSFILMSFQLLSVSRKNYSFHFGTIRNETTPFQGESMIT
jgi:hypothetical protein